MASHERPVSEEIAEIAEVDQKAFELIEGFKKTLSDLPEFRDRAVDTYFGELPSDFLGAPGISIVDPNDKRRIEFQVGRYTAYELIYSFSRKLQMLKLSKSSVQGEPDSGGYVRTEAVHLRSRRFKDQEPDLSATVRYELMPSLGGDKWAGYTNTPLALQKAKEVLADLSPKK